MNKKIESLANVWANRRDLDDKLGITYTFSESALEMFAENLVNKCIELTLSNNVNPAAAIIVHFGGEIE